MAFSLQEALEQIRSDKIKSRQQGLEALEFIFSDQDNVIKLDPKQDGRAWLKTFQALFECVLAEKAACIRKGSFDDAQPIAIARLQRAAQVLRSLVEKSASLLTRKVVKALISHILQMLNHRGSLLKPIAPAYVSALCAMLKHQHHVDHLDPEDWWEAACLCFDILLGRDFNPPIAPSSAAEWLAAIPRSPPKSTPKRGLSLEDATTAECVRYLMGCTVAPLLGPEGHGIQLLADYTHFLLAYPTESSAHMPALTGLVMLLEHLEMNNTIDVINATLTLQSALLTLWKTKNHLLKVQLLLCFRIVSPLLASWATKQTELDRSPNTDNVSPVRRDAYAFLKLIHNTLFRDPDTRRALEPICMDSLIFRYPQPDEAGVSCQGDEAFANSAFSLGPYSQKADTIAWCRVNLQVDLIDALEQLETLGEDDGPLTFPDQQVAQAEFPVGTPANGTADAHVNAKYGKRPPNSAPSTPSKRRRTGTAEENPNRSWFIQILGTISNNDASIASSATSRLSALQLLVFLVLTRPNLLDAASIADARKASLLVASESNGSLASWSLVAFAAMVLNSTKTDDQNPEVEVISHIWGIAVRKLQLPATCRAAAFLLSCMLAKGSLSESTLQSEISRLLSEVDLQGPPIMCDSVCHLMTLLLHRTTSIRMYQPLDPRRKIGAWFSTTYNPADAFRSTSSAGSNPSAALFLPYHDMYRLVISIVSEDSSRCTGSERFASADVDDAIAKLLRRRARLKPLRDLSLNPTTVNSPSTKTVEKDYATSSLGSGSSLYSEEAFHRLTVVLEKKVNVCLDALDAADSREIPCSVAVPAIHIAVLAMDFFSRSPSQGHAQHISRLRDCCKVVVKLIDSLSLSKALSADEYALVAQQLDLLAPPVPSCLQHDTEAGGLLLYPGAASGIVSYARNTPSAGDDQRRAHAFIHDEASKRMWTAIRDCNMLDPIMSCCERLLERALFGDEDIEPTAPCATVSTTRDAFDDMQESDSSSSIRANLSPVKLSSGPARVIVNIAVRLLGSIPRLLTGNSVARNDEHIVSLFFDCSVEALVALSPVLFQSLRCNILWMSQRDLVDALDRIGGELLTSYTFARDPTARMAAISAVSAAIPLLLEDPDEQSDLFDKVQKLAIFFADQIGRTKWPTPWEVQMACADFLATCLHLDPEGALRRSGSARGTAFFPTKALMQMNADPDVRVRGLGSAVAATVFDATSVESVGTSDLYASFREVLPSDSSIPQHILTRALSLSNVAIASSSVRQSSLFHLLEIVLATGMFPTTIQQLFAQIADRLGFTDASSCYQAFAGQITWGMTTNGYDPLQIPWKVLGFASKRECLEATFAACGSMLLAAQTSDGRTQFDALVQLTRRSNEQGLQECLPFLTAAYLGFAIQTGLDSNSLDLQGICQRTLRDLSELGFARSEDHTVLRNMIIDTDDMIVLMLLSLYYDEGLTLVESRRSAISALNKQDAEAGKILAALTPSSDSNSCILHEPSRPFFSAEVICTALATLSHLGIEAFREDVVYNTLRHIFHHIASSQFVNQQLRLCGALRLYVALCGDAFWSDQLNTGVLIKSIEQLLGQHHLHEDLRPFLVYACSHSVLPRQAPETLVSCIVAWSVECHEHLARSPQDYDWLLSAARVAAETASVATSATALLWPVKFTSTEYLAIESMIDLGTLVFAIESCPPMSLQLPALLRIRAVLRKASKAELDSFCQRSAWRLLERMAGCRIAESIGTGPDARSDLISDIFATIMSACETALLERERHHMDAPHKTIAERYLETVDTSQFRSMSASIILTVHQLSQSLPLGQAYQAFEALRGIAATGQGILSDAHSSKMAAAAKEELNRIRPSTITPTSIPRVATLGDLSAPVLLQAAASFDRWICRLCTTLCELLLENQQHSLFAAIRSFVSSNVEAAKALFPILLLCCTGSEALNDSGTMASSTKGKRRAGTRSSDSHTRQASSMATCRMAVAKHFEQVLESTTADATCSKMIIQALLTVRALRPVAEEPDNVCFWFDVDTSLLARRCIACGLYTASIFFVEHSMWEQDESQTSTASLARNRTNLLHQAYMNIDDPDAFYGITDGDVRELLLKRLHHEGQWLRAFQYHAADFEASSLGGESARSSAAQGLGQSLTRLGFSHLNDRVEGGNPSGGAGIGGHDFKAFSWDLPGNPDAELSVSSSIDRMLQTLRQANSEQDVDKPLSMAIQSHLQALCSTAAESVQQMRTLQGNLLALGQIKDWRKASASLGPEEAVAHLRPLWAQTVKIDQFEVAEKVLTTRQSVLESARIRMQSVQIGDVLDGPAESVAKVERSLLVLLSQQAREHAKLQKAINATARAERIEAALSDGANLAREEFAAVLWEQNEHSPAIQLLSQIVDGLNVTEHTSAPQRRRVALLLSLLAQWRATARSQHPREIDQVLFEPALKLTTSPATPGMTQGSTDTDQTEIAYRWARFAEENHRGSDMTEITRLRLYIDRRREEIAQNQRECERATSMTERSKLLQFQRQADKILRQDQTRLTELEASRTHFLRRSTVMYVRALASSDAHDDAVARLVSLWFEHALDLELNRLLANCLASIPSRKFVPLLHQLSARLTEVPSSASEDSTALFQKNLFTVLLGMCQDHPFHCLYAIFALVKTGADAKATLDRPSPRSSLAPSGGTSPSPSPQILRSTAAEKIWNQIKKRSAHGKRIRTFEELCLAYVEWAEYDLTSRPDRYFQSSGSIKKGALRMPPSGELRLSRMKDLDVPVATARLEIDPTCRYETFVSIARYSETFTTAGGIHLPKISECIGSDGKRYKQLFKRDDDLRQDAVMQQIFRMVNELLHADRRTRERHLAIRTYVVLPLGPQCGMLEFVTNTMPLGEVLIALHGMYRPNDLSPAQARAKLRDAQPLPAEAKLEAFLDVCEAMRPAFRYFFSDAQRMPRDWYETRLRYTRSVSTNSIVGHVLGLGDRHVSNILLDKQSGELVHIDFGIAFDQGKLLPIPELVPFRLTRDIVDGMGVNGVEGTFRRCCEETLRVLRAHQDVIKTVLEVFRHDPLFAWTSNPIKVLRAQEGDENSMPVASEERSGRSTPAPTPAPMRATTPLKVPAGQTKVVGTDTAELSADRAVASVMTKLSSSLSVEYTVNDLIQQAMDAGNLSAIFHGWQAAL